MKKQKALPLLLGILIFVTMFVSGCGHAIFSIYDIPNVSKLYKGASLVDEYTDLGNTENSPSIISQPDGNSYAVYVKTDADNVPITYYRNLSLDANVPNISHKDNVGVSIVSAYNAINAEYISRLDHVISTEYNLTDTFFYVVRTFKDGENTVTKNAVFSAGGSVIFNFVDIEKEDYSNISTPCKNYLQIDSKLYKMKGNKPELVLDLYFDSDGYFDYVLPIQHLGGVFAYVGMDDYNEINSFYFFDMKGNFLQSFNTRDYPNAEMFAYIGNDNLLIMEEYFLPENDTDYFCYYYGEKLDVNYKLFNVRTGKTKIKKLDYYLEFIYPVPYEIIYNFKNSPRVVANAKKIVDGKVQNNVKLLLDGKLNVVYEESQNENSFPISHNRMIVENGGITRLQDKKGKDIATFGDIEVLDAELIYDIYGDKYYNLDGKLVFNGEDYLNIEEFAHGYAFASRLKDKNNPESEVEDGILDHKGNFRVLNLDGINYFNRYALTYYTVKDFNVTLYNMDGTKLYECADYNKVNQVSYGYKDGKMYGYYNIQTLKDGKYGNTIVKLEIKK